MKKIVTIIQIAITFSFSGYFLLYQDKVISRIKKEYGIKENALNRYRVMGNVISYFAIFVGLLLVYSLF